MPSVHTLKGIITSVSKHANTILATLREEFTRKDIRTIVQELSDVPLRSQDIGRTISVIDDANKNWERMKFTRRDSVIRQGYMRVKDPGKKRFSTVIQSKVTHQTTGETFDSFITITHDEPLTRASLEGAAHDLIDDFGERPYLEVSEQKPVQGFVYRPRKR